MSRHKPTTSRLNWKKKLAFSLVSTFAFFLLLELLLALMGVQSVTSTHDPSAGFSNQLPLLVSQTNSDGDEILVTAVNKEVWFNPQSFPKTKPPGTTRVFCLGGSTTFGRPFSDSTSYVRWLRDLLPKVDPTQNWEIFNAGGVSYASHRVTAVMRELAQYEPDLFIVYSAQNEFLERRTYARMFGTHSWTSELSAAALATRTGSLIHRVATRIGSGNSNTESQSPDSDSPSRQPFPEEVDELLNHSIGPSQYERDEIWQQEVINEYQLNLQEMIAIARSTDAKIVFITPASNLRGSSPFKSQFDDGRDAQMLSQQIQLAEEHLRNNQLDLALETMTRVIQESPRSADAQYLLGRIQFAHQNWTAAEQAFQSALNEDICPLRAISPLKDVLRSVIEKADVPVVEFDTLLRAKSLQEHGHECLGDDYFLDHVHPTLDVHRQLAVWIIDELLQQSLISGQPPSDASIAVVQQRIDDSIDYQKQGLAFRNLAKLNHWGGKFSEAVGSARRSIAITPNDLESRFMLADSLTNLGQYEAAHKEYRDLFDIGDYPRAYLPYGELLLNKGLAGEAEPFLVAALITDNEEHIGRAFYNLGLLYSATEQYQLAVESLDHVLDRYPDDSATMVLKAHCLRKLKRDTEAISLLRRVLAEDAEHPTANHEMAEACLEIKDFRQAQRHIDAALRAEPDNPAFQATLLRLQQSENPSS